MPPDSVVNILSSRPMISHFICPKRTKKGQTYIFWNGFGDYLGKRVPGGSSTFFCFYDQITGGGLQKFHQNVQM